MRGTDRVLMAAYLALLGLRLGPAGAAGTGPVQYPALYCPPRWVRLEWLRGWLFSGFPWLSLGLRADSTDRLRRWAPVGRRVWRVPCGGGDGAGALVLLLVLAAGNRARLAGLALLLAWRVSR